MLIISMNVRITPRQFTGTIKAPASKSHTIRQLLIASLADGVSEIKDPLDSLDTRSCAAVCKAFGAEIAECRSAGGQRLHDSFVSWNVKGNNGFKHNLPAAGLQVDVGNSGTTLYFALAVAGLQPQPIEFTGDEQIKRRSAAPLLEALAGLGVQPQSSNGCAPITIKGPWAGGKAILPCPTSQYLSALLIAAPLAQAGTVTEIEVPLLNEKPYIDMTLSYLTAHGIPFETALLPCGGRDYSRFVIRGGSSWKPFCSPVPGDFSSAAFPAAAAAITGGSLTILGLCPQDTQGDKYFFDMLSQMGCEIRWQQESVTVSRSGVLRGGTFDLNAAPDLLPAAAAIAAYAEGDTALVNTAHARIKETDRIAVMKTELAKLGVDCTELPDGLIIHGKGGLPTVEKKRVINSRGDHRIFMAFAAAALGGKTPMEITGAESAAVSYPEFLQLVGAEQIDG